MANGMDRLERRFSWLAVPHIAVLLITLQALGFLMVAADSRWWGRLALFPDAVLDGAQYWRLITFLALPISTSPIFVIFVLWFLYFIVNTLEREWGAFKTTLYVLVSWWVTAGFSLAFGYPVTHIGHFESTLFLAAAVLYPEVEILLFMIIPVKMKWLAWVTVFFVGWELIQGDWMDRFFVVAIYSNFIVFFGPSLLGGVRLAWRRWNYRRKLGK